MRTRPASIATIVIAIGLVLTSIGIARSLPFTFGGVGSRATVAQDAWAHGTAVSPALVALVFIAILAVIATRPTRGGGRAAAWLAVLSGALIVAGAVEPVQQQLLLFTTVDVALTPLVYALHVGLIALALSAIGEARQDRTGSQPFPADGPVGAPALGATPA
jgi:hypothetical protein